eukprot:gnl/TRDRNA2_/TRDRNA2_82305_c0_seq1.p1 gnl/TRDRNA2_/TRDRNA2_82305_c0~~gnl/TRDRNA2_/TRDRNA2_82305_c0_seq1.p1  ORF type:complete len:200 (+),score=30.42 gnl/TRDRNA2_/TRDRNA2_82305_c0_seq1:128-727(+)
MPMRFFVASVWLAAGTWYVSGQYDFPLDSCACHIHYEVWVQLQLRLSVVLTPEFADRLLEEGSEVQVYIGNQDCRDPRKLGNILEWTLGPANSDCVPGHMSQFILCSQAYLMRGDLDGARRYFDLANYMFPLALPCMDAAIWTITPEAFYDRYRSIIVAAEAKSAVGGERQPLQDAEIRMLAWRPSPMDNSSNDGLPRR